MVALVGMFLGVMSSPTTLSAREANRPYTIPGDADGPAGVQEATAAHVHADGGILPLCVSVGPWHVGLIVIRIDGARTITWFKSASTGSSPSESPKR